MLRNLFARFFTREPGRIDWPRTGLLCIALLAVFAALWLWLHPRDRIVAGPVRLMPGETVTVASPPKVIEKIRKVMVPGPAQVQVIEKEKLVKELVYIPAEVANDSQEQAVSAAEVPIELQGQDCGAVQTTTFLNLSTGKATTVAHVEPPDFFGIENHGELGLWYGYNQHAKEVLEGSLSWYFLRIGPAHLGIRGEADNGVNIKALGGLKYGW